MTTACRHALLTRIAAPLAAAALLAAVAASTAGASSLAACGAGQLAGKVRQSSGAAGTAAVSVRVRNVSPSGCTLRGFPRLRLRSDAGPLPTLVRHGGLAILERPVETIVLGPGESATLLVAFGTLSTGATVACPRATRLVIVLRDGRGRFSVPFDGAPCDRGTLRASPFLEGLVGV